MRSITAAPGYTMKILVGDFNLNKILWSPDPELPAHTFQAILNCLLEPQIVCWIELSAEIWPSKMSAG